MFFFLLGFWGGIGERGESEVGGCSGEKRGVRRVRVGVDLQVDELAFVVFHDCCGVGDIGGGYFMIAIALIEVYIERKRFGGRSRLASWRSFSPNVRYTIVGIGTWNL